MYSKLKPWEPEGMRIRPVLRNDESQPALLMLQLRPGAMPPGHFGFLTLPAARRLRELLDEALANTPDDPGAEGQASEEGSHR